VTDQPYTIGARFWVPITMTEHPIVGRTHPAEPGDERGWLVQERSSGVRSEWTHDELTLRSKFWGRRRTEDKKRRNQARRRALFAAIRRDAAAGLSGRALERKHHVGRRTIVKALASETPPPRKKIDRKSAALHGLHHHINAVIEGNPAVAVKDVWAHLVDDHDTTVSYGAIRAYVAERKAERAGETNPTGQQGTSDS